MPLLLFLISAWPPRNHGPPPAADVIGHEAEAEVPLPRLTSLVTKGMTSTLHAFNRFLRYPIPACAIDRVRAIDRACVVSCLFV
jgi:hypothetical protein